MCLIKQIQNWYLSQCDGDWEHGYGISIGTLDNPGWTVEINLKDTPLERALFNCKSYGVGEEADPESDNWLHCFVEDSKFRGVGGPEKLEEILAIFLSWAERTTPKTT